MALASPGGTPGNGLPVGPGFRVPCLIVSPWTTGGRVIHDPFDHTSILRFLEVLTGVEATNISQYRRKTLGDLTSAFQFGPRNQVPPVLPDTSGPATLAAYTSTCHCRASRAPPRPFLTRTTSGSSLSGRSRSPPAGL